jgi:carbohydrate diacid regulator
LALAQGQFERVAETVTERASDLLLAPVSVVDEQGVVVASSEPSLLGSRLDSDGRDGVGAYLGVPLRLDSRSGMIIIGYPLKSPIIPPRLARVLVELVISQATVVDRLPNHHELKDKFIHDLLRGSWDSEAVMLREAQILGMDLAPPRVVILIDAADYILAASPGEEYSPDRLIRQRAQVVITSVVDFFHLPNDTICAYIGEGEVAVLKASNKQNLSAWVSPEDAPVQSNPSWANLAALKRAATALLRQLCRYTAATLNVGIGRYHPGISGLARSYSDARAALSLGRRFHGPNQVHCLDSLGIAAFVGVSDEHTKLDLATYLLTPLDHEPELLETVRTFFAHDCQPSRSAQALSIHRNTLGYRLDKIASLTGLDPRHFDDAVQIRLALALRSLGAS